MATRLEAAVRYLHTEVYGWPNGINPNLQDITDPPDCDARSLRTKQFIISARGLQSASLASHSLDGKGTRRTTASGKLDQRAGTAPSRDGKKRVRFDIPDSKESEDNEPSAPALNLTREPTGYEFDFPGGQYGPDGNKFLLVWPISPDQQQSPAPWFAAVSCLYRALHRNVWVGDWDTEAPTQPATDSGFENHESYYEWQEILAGLGLAFSFWCLRSANLGIRKQLCDLAKTNRNDPEKAGPTVTEIRSAINDVQARMDNILNNLDQDSELQTYEDVIDEVWEWSPGGEDLKFHLATLHKAILQAIKSAEVLLSSAHCVREMVSSIESVKAQRHRHAASRYMDGAPTPMVNDGAYSVHPSILKAVSEGTSLIETAVREFIEAQKRIAARVADLQDVDEQFDIASPDNSVHAQDLEGSEEELLANKCRRWVARLSREIMGICDIYDGYFRAVMEADSALYGMVEGEAIEPESEAFERGSDGVDHEDTIEVQRTAPKDLGDPPCLLPDAL